MARAAAHVLLVLASRLRALAEAPLRFVRYEQRADGLFLPAVLVLAGLIFGAVQAGGGAYTAEFDGYADEAAHFMTGLMVRDYLVQWPLPRPLPWAERYYLHYPKVAFGHWPPLFHLVEAGWWLFVPPSRVTAMLLIGLLGWAAAVCYYRLMRRYAGSAAALGMSCLLVATPVFQMAAGQVMAETLSLLLGVLFLGALIHFLDEQTARHAALAGLWCGLALLVKGTAAYLAVAPFVALVLLGRWRPLLSRATAVLLAATFAAGGFWYVLLHVAQRQAIVMMGAMYQRVPWNVLHVLKVAGPGWLALAAAGAVALLWIRTPAAAACSAILLSGIVGSLVMGAMNEPRHWILALPAILLGGVLCLEYIARVRRLRLVAAAAVACAILVFPWMRYRQQPAGYAELSKQIRQPARMLVSGSPGWSEGSWITLASLRENRPSSVCARATKLLARSNWAGNHYKSLVESTAAVEATLDRLAFDDVILDDHLPVPMLPHQKLLHEALENSAAWKECAASGKLRAYCRVTPLPKTDRLRIDLKMRLGRILEEE